MGASFPKAGASRDQRGAAPSVTNSPTPETFRSGQAATTAAQSASVTARQRLRAGSACHGGLCPHPLRKLSFLRTFLLLPPLRTRGAAKLNPGASHYHNGAAPSVTNFAHTRNAPQQSSRHHGGVDCVPHCASATASRLSLGSLKFPHRRSCQTKPSLMEGSSTMMKWPTSRMVS